MQRFVLGPLAIASSHLMTDEFSSYHSLDGLLPHDVIPHAYQYADGPIHTNTLEGFWRLLKRAWSGSHHHYSEHFMPLSVAETCWKYKHRKDTRAFDTFLRPVFR